MRPDRLPAAPTLAVGLFGGSVAGLLEVPGALEAVLTLLAAGCGAWLCAGRRTRSALHLLLLAAACSAGFLGAAAAVPPPLHGLPRDGLADALVEVVRPPEVTRDGDALLVARLPGCPPRALARIRVRPSATPLPDCQPGQRLRVSGFVRVPRAPGNPGGRDHAERLRRRGIVLSLTAPAAGAVRPTGPPDGAHLRRAGEALRAATQERLARALSGRRPATPLLTCLLLGDRSRLGDELREDFRRAGLSHLLAVSGLHVVLLMGAVAWLLRRLLARLPRPRVARLLEAVLLLALLAAYVAACRFATPVTRAAVFVTVATLARAAGRRTCGLDHLSAAAAIVLAADPTQALDTGFHLSFAAVLGLVLLTRRFEEALFPGLDVLRRFPEAIPRWRLRLANRGSRAICAALAAQTATLPIVAAQFGEAHLVGPLANVVAVPFVAVLLPCAALLAALGDATPAVFSWLVSGAADVTAAVVAVIADLPAASVTAGPPQPLVLLSAVGALGLAASFPRWRRRHLLLPLAALGLLVAAPHGRTARGPEAVALDVGQGLAVLVRGGGGSDVLLDAGGRLPGVAARRILPALRAAGVTRLAMVTVSHEDADHCQALPAILAALPVGEVVVPAGFGGDPAARRVLAACAEAHVPVRRVGRGDRIVRRDLTIRVLHPRRDRAGPVGNEGSLVLHVRAGGGERPLTLLLTGDIEGPPLRALAADATLPRAEVLLLPHHGRGDPAPQLALARRAGARVLIASTAAGAPTRVPGALVTGRDGAVRVRPGAAPETYPW